MARHLRMEYPGALDHFTARGTDRQTIVHAETDRADCLMRLGPKMLPAASAQGHLTMTQPLWAPIPICRVLAIHTADT